MIYMDKNGSIFIPSGTIEKEKGREIYLDYYEEIKPDDPRYPEILELFRNHNVGFGSIEV